MATGEGAPSYGGKQPPYYMTPDRKYVPGGAVQPTAPTGLLSSAQIKTPDMSGLLTTPADYSMGGPAPIGMLDVSTKWEDPGGWSGKDAAGDMVTAGIKQGPRDITDNELVAHQLNKLIADNSEYVQSAENRAYEQAAARGLINSTMAVGAGRRAAIDAALPIATSDAGTYATSGLSAQEAGQTAAIQTAQQQNQAFLNQQNIAGNITLGEQQTARDMATAKLRTQADIDIARAEIKSKQDMQAVALANGDNQLAAKLGTEIATAQAQTDTELLRQQMSDASALERQQAGDTAAMARQQAADDAALVRQTAEDYMTILDENGQPQQVHVETYLKELGIKFEADKLDVQSRAEMGGNVSSILTAYNTELTNLMRDPNLKGDSRDKAIGSLRNSTVASLNAQARIYEMDLSWSVSDLPA